MNKAGEMLLHSAGDKLPESTGDKLPESTGEKLPESTGEDDSTFLGKPRIVPGNGSTGCLYSAGEQSYIKTAGDAC